MRQFRRWPSAGTKLATSCEEELTSDTYNSMGANQELQQIRASDTTYKLHARKCRDPGANRGPSDLRPDAFPTELSRLMPLDGRMGPMSDRGASMLHKGLQIEGEGFGELRFVM
jgi:hypothetical protein